MLNCTLDEYVIKNKEKLNKFTIDSYLATILLSGIVLDTNSYVLKTDTNTFYYSYYLLHPL